MIPIRLELTAFGPFVETQVVDFERLGAHGLFLIHGQTGAGKSSLLDALTFALFGDTSGGARDGEDMVTSLAAGLSTEVALEFTHAGSRYRVERSPRHQRAKKRGEGFTSVPPKAALYEVRRDEPTGATGASGENRLLVLAEGKDAVTAKIRELLHCDAKQFRQTVVLPQGQFRQVIEDDTTRRSTLAQLFDTGRFKRLQERLSEYAKHLRSDVAEAEASLAELRETHQVPDLAGLEAKLKTALAGLHAALEADKAAAAAEKLAIEAHAAGKRLFEDFSALAKTREELSGLAQRADEIEACRRRLADEIRARDAEPAVARWRASVTEAGARLAAVERCEHEMTEASRRREDAAARATEHEKDRAQRDAAADTATRLELLAPELANYTSAHEEHQVAEGVLAAAAEDAAAAAKARDELLLSRAEIESAITAKEKQLEALGDTSAKLVTATARAKAARNAHEALRTLGALGATGSDFDLGGLWLPLSRALAARLEPGEPCPVCGSLDHDGDQHPSPPDPTAALGELESALRSAQEGQLAAASQRAAADERLRASLADGGWADPDDLPSLAEVEASVALASDASSNAKRLTEELRGHRVERERLAAAAEASAGTLDSANAKKHAAEIRLTAARTTLDDLAKRLEPRYRGDPGAFTRELQAAEGAVTTFDERARALSEAAAEAEKAQAVAAEKLRLAQEESKASASAAEKAEAAAHKALRRHGFVTEDGAPDADAQQAALLDPDERVELTERVRGHSEALSAAEAREKQLLASTEGRAEPDLEALQAAVDEATRARETAAQTAESARRLRDSLRSDSDRWRQTEAALGAKRGRHRTAQHLADLANGQVTGAYRLDLETYVLRRILTDVLLLANRHLAGMTGGRFQLRLNTSETELRESGLRLDVEDRHAGGRRRSVKTLSGGEGFQASLALALGLAETAQRTSGAVEIGALFVDEGFGSLDSATLEEVVTILRRLPGDQHRMVGVITHVEALKGRINAQLEVVSGAADWSGSSVRHSFG